MEFPCMNVLSIRSICTCTSISSSVTSCRTLAHIGTRIHTQTHTRRHSDDSFRCSNVSISIFNRWSSITVEYGCVVCATQSNEFFPFLLLHPCSMHPTGSNTHFTMWFYCRIESILPWHLFHWIVSFRTKPNAPRRQMTITISGNRSIHQMEMKIECFVEFILTTRTLGTVHFSLFSYIQFLDRGEGAGATGLVYLRQPVTLKSMNMDNKRVLLVSHQWLEGRGRGVWMVI